MAALSATQHTVIPQNNSIHTSSPSPLALPSPLGWREEAIYMSTYEFTTESEEQVNHQLLVRK